MTCGLIVTADGFDNVQLRYAYYRLREDAVLVDVASPDGGRISGESDASWDGTIPIDALDREYDLLVVPGGSAAEHLSRDGATTGYLREAFDAGTIVAAVGTGVGVLGEAGLLEGRTVTGPPDLEPGIKRTDGVPTDEAVAVDGRLVTAQGASCLPFLFPAVLNNVVVPQSPAEHARERPSWGAID